MNQAKIYIDNYFYFIDSQVIEIHDSDSDSNMEETHILLFQNINVKKIPKFCI